jgi:hypothetical protein
MVVQAKSCDVMPDYGDGRWDYCKNPINLLSDSQAADFDSENVRYFGIELEYALLFEDSDYTSQFNKLRGMLSAINNTAIVKSDISVTDMNYLREILGYYKEFLFYTPFEEEYDDEAEFFDPRAGLKVSYNRVKSGEFVFFPQVIEDYPGILESFFDTLSVDYYGPYSELVQKYLAGFTHEHCGMHVHVNKSSISIQTLKNMVILLGKIAASPSDLSTLSMVCGRDVESNTYCRVHTFLPTYGSYYKDASTGKDVPMIEYNKYLRNSGKYEILNTSKSNTLEWRGFKAPSSLDEALARLDFFKDFIEFSEMAEEDDLIPSEMFAYCGV